MLRVELLKIELKFCDGLTDTRNAFYKIADMYLAKCGDGWLRCIKPTQPAFEKVEKESPLCILHLLQEKAEMATLKDGTLEKALRFIERSCTHTNIAIGDIVALELTMSNFAEAEKWFDKLTDE